jgi:hypothetical protein
VRATNSPRDHKTNGMTESSGEHLGQHVMLVVNSSSENDTMCNTATPMVSVIRVATLYSVDRACSADFGHSHNS